MATHIVNFPDAHIQSTKITATTSVGIGTSGVDAYPLTIFKETEPEIRILEGTTQSSAARLYSNNSNLYIQTGADFSTGSSGDIAFQTMDGQSTHMIIKSDGKVGVGTMEPRAPLDINSTDAMILPVGTTAQQPNTSYTGMVRFNTDKGTIEYYNGSNWATVGGVSASGGTETNASGYKIHTFSSVGNTTFNVYTGGSIEVLLVAGGGGGGGRSGGGGGGGGVVHKTSHDVTPGSYTITVGAGGSGGISSGSYGSNGNDSTAFGLTAKGGGGGASDNAGANPGQGNDGGCGGGGRYGGNGGSATQTSQTGDSGTYGHGYGGGGSAGASYYNGGGGGGAGGVGGTGTTTSNGNGGVGYQTDISGTNKYYAGGGGGGSHDPWPGAIGTGGNGGGGNGGNNSTSTNGGNGTDGLGGGGGAGSTTSGNGGTGGTGGDGVVIIRYLS